MVLLLNSYDPMAPIGPNSDTFDPESNVNPETTMLTENFADFLTQTDDGYITYGVDFAVLAINPGGCRLLGIASQPIVGQPCTVVLGDQAADIELFLEEVLETGEKVYVEHSFWVEQQQSYFDTVYTPIRAPGGAIVEILGIYRDVTSLKMLQQSRDRNLEQRAQQAEERLRQVEDQKKETEEQLRASFTHGSVAKALVGRQGEILQVNPALCQLIGYSAQELQQHVVSDFTYPEDLHIDDEQRESLRRNDGISEQREKRLVHKAGHPVWTLMSVVWVKQADQDEPSFYIIEMQNLTQLKETELALKEAKEKAEEATRAKSAFLAMMSHEIRTPMNAVIGSTELLNETALDPQQLDYLQTIRTGGDTLLSVIDDILDFSKIEAGKLELEIRPFSVQTCIEEALDIVYAKALAKGLELIPFVDADTPSVVLGDRTRLRQILVNLLGNAVKFTDQGEVLVSVCVLTDQSSVHSAEPASAAPPRYHLKFAVQDTGIGIAAEQQSLLFQSFSQADTSITRRYGGTGLGLAISKRLCELMQGQIWVESQPGAGSTFYFTIQATGSTAALGQQTVGTDRNTQALQNRRVLIVDDNETNRRILGRQLQSWGMAVTLAASGPEALAILQAEPTFDVALLDVQMPGMTGLDLTEQIQAQYGVTVLPIVLLSSVGPVTQDLELRSLTVVASLSKPVKKARLQQLLHHTLNPLKILVAEDNPVNQKVALRMLEHLGYVADLVENGQAVLDALQAQRYDVVFLDIQMAIMDGLTTAQRICEQWPVSTRPYLIAMTANAMQGDRDACLNAGMNDYVSKPIHLKTLSDALAPCRPLSSQ